MTSTMTTYAITGANRGVGRAITDIILLRPNHKVIALVRDPADATSQSLLTQETGPGSSVTVLQYDAADPSSVEQIPSTLQSPTHNINQIDVVIANAGTMGETGTLFDISAASYQKTLTINTIGPVLLLKTLYHPFLQNSPTPKFIAISSAIGSTGMIPQRGNVATALGYGMSKAALNHAICKLNQAYGQTVAFGIFTPGVTRTNFGGPGFDWSKMPHANSVDVIGPGLVQRVDETQKTKPGENPVFRDWKGDIIPW